jgi:hypothetical protein
VLACARIISAFVHLFLFPSSWLQVNHTNPVITVTITENTHPLSSSRLRTDGAGSRDRSANRAITTELTTTPSEHT